jgi:ribosomal protein L17
MAARKKAEKPKRPEHPGRFIPGERWEGERGESNERVQITLDAERTKAYRERVIELEKESALQSSKVSEEKRKLAELKRESDELTTAIIHGHLEARRDVFKFVDDEAQTVSLYDAKTDELLQVRPMLDYERQENMDLKGDEGEDA